MSVVLAACGSEDAGRAATSSTLAGDTVRMSLAWEVARGVHPAADSLGDVSGVAMDDAGNIYATDFQAARIWVFDAEGRFVEAVGRRGQGPGEFENPTGPAVGPDGRLYVRDRARVNVLGPDSATGHLTRYVDRYAGGGLPDWMSRRTTRFDTTGGVLFPGDQWSQDGTAAPFVVPFTPGGETGDTVFVPPQPTAPQLTAWVQTSPNGGRMLEGLGHVPFAPLPAWDVTPAGTIVSGDGREYRLVETDRAGDTVRVFERSVAPEPIPAGERGDSVAALRLRLDSVPVPLDDVQGMPEAVRTLEVPETYPAYMAVYADGDGRVWVRRWPVGGGDRTVFDRFAPTGEFLDTVVLDREILIEPTPVLTSDAVVGVALHPLTDESMILAFELDREA